MDIALINKIASKSLPANTKNRFLRHFYRKLVFLIGERYADLNLSQRPKINGVIDLEPWPYSDPNFCPWEEDDSDDHYTLFGNPAGFVIGYPTAYCSAMIKQTTGHWPLIRNFADAKDSADAALAQTYWQDAPHRFDAKNWLSFLSLNGFHEYVGAPATGCHYIGVNQQQGEYGSVVWFERPADKPDQVIVSTRINREFRVMTVSTQDYVWVKIKE